MSVCISKGSLTEEQVRLVIKQLVLQPISPPDYSNKGRSKASAPSKPPIQFYIRTDDSLYLPFSAAAKILGRPVNQDRKVRKVSVKFVGSLRSNIRGVNQVEVVRHAYEEQLERYGSATIVVPPGSGKTVMASKLMTLVGTLTIVLLHRVNLVPQWKKTFESNTDAKVWVVGESYLYTEPPDVILCMITRVSQIPQEYKDAIGFLIADEAHALSVPSAVEPILSCCQPPRVLLLSATPERDDGMHVMLYSLAGMHRFEVPLLRDFQVFQICTGFNYVVERSNRGVKWDLLQHAMFDNEARNNMIIDRVRVLKEYKILVYTSFVPHAKLLTSLLAEQGESVDMIAGDKSICHDRRVVVATIQKAGTGFDQELSCLEYSGIAFNCLLLVCSLKKVATLIQTIGRVFRTENPIIIDFYDRHKTLQRHASIRREWYESAGGKVMLL